MLSLLKYGTIISEIMMMSCSYGYLSFQLGFGRGLSGLRNFDFFTVKIESNRTVLCTMSWRIYIRIH